MSSSNDAAVASPPTRGSARDHILEIGKRLFAERGFDSVSISDIARETGVSKANIFHHFDSKEGLYLAIIAGVLKRYPDRTSSVTPDRDVVASFQDVAAAELREAEMDQLGVRLILQEVISGDPQRSRVLANDVFAGHFTQLVELIRAQQVKGHFRRDMDPALAATVLRSATAFFMLSRHVLRHLPGVSFAEDPERYAREATNLVLRGLVTTPNDREE